jgi:hypothetical protein
VPAACGAGGVGRGGRWRRSRGVGRRSRGVVRWVHALVCELESAIGTTFFEGGPRMFGGVGGERGLRGAHLVVPQRRNHRGGLVRRQEVPETWLACRPEATLSGRRARGTEVDATSAWEGRRCFRWSPGELAAAPTHQDAHHGAHQRAHQCRRGRHARPWAPMSAEPAPFRRARESPDARVQNGTMGHPNLGQGACGLKASEVARC